MNNRLKIYQKKKYQRKIKKAVTIIGIAFFVCSSAQLLLDAFNFMDLTISAEDIEWNVLLNITEPGGAYDTVLFGEAFDADDEKDNYDVPKPPSEPYIFAWFTSNIDVPYNNLWEDYRAYSDDYQTWNLSVEWSSENKSLTTVNVSWEISQITPSGYTSTILYHNDVLAADMMTDDNYHFLANTGIPNHFQIICQHETSNGETKDASTNTSLSFLLPVFVIIIFIVIVAFIWKKIKT